MSDEEYIAPQNSHRFFRAPQYVYDGAREYFIEVFNQPKEGTIEPFPPYADARTVKDGEEFAIVALLQRECEWPEVVFLLQDLLDAGQIEEIDEDEYLDAINSNGSEF